MSQRVLSSEACGDVDWPAVSDEEGHKKRSDGGNPKLAHDCHRTWCELEKSMSGRKKVCAVSSWMIVAITPPLGAPALTIDFANGF